MWRQLAEQSKTAKSRACDPCLPHEPPSSFTCPITKDLMRDPVTLTDGHSYDRTSIAAWLSRHNTSPMTNETLRSADVFPNHALRGAIAEWIELHPGHALPAESEVAAQVLRRPPDEDDEDGFYDDEEEEDEDDSAEEEDEEEEEDNEEAIARRMAVARRMAGRRVRAMAASLEPAAPPVVIIPRVTQIGGRVGHYIDRISMLVEPYESVAHGGMGGSPIVSKVLRETEQVVGVTQISNGQYLGSKFVFNISIPAGYDSFTIEGAVKPQGVCKVRKCMVPEHQHDIMGMGIVDLRIQAGQLTAVKLASGAWVEAEETRVTYGPPTPPIRHGPGTSGQAMHAARARAPPPAPPPPSRPALRPSQSTQAPALGTGEVLAGVGLAAAALTGFAMLSDWMSDSDRRREQRR